MSSWFLKETGSAISTVYQWLQGDRRDQICRRYRSRPHGSDEWKRKSGRGTFNEEL